MIQVLWSSLQYIYTQIQIHIGCKYKYNNRGQILYVVRVRQICSYSLKLAPIIFCQITDQAQIWHLIRVFLLVKKIWGKLSELWQCCYFLAPGEWSEPGAYSEGHLFSELKNFVLSLTRRVHAGLRRFLVYYILALGTGTKIGRPLKMKMRYLQ